MTSRPRVHRAAALVTLVCASFIPGALNAFGAAAEAPRPENRNGAGATRQETSAPPQPAKPQAPGGVRRVVTRPLIFVGADE